MTGSYQTINSNIDCSICFIPTDPRTAVLHPNCFNEMAVAHGRCFLKWGNTQEDAGRVALCICEKVMDMNSLREIVPISLKDCAITILTPLSKKISPTFKPIAASAAVGLGGLQATIAVVVAMVLSNNEVDRRKFYAPVLIGAFGAELGLGSTLPLTLGLGFGIAEGLEIGLNRIKARLDRASLARKILIIAKSVDLMLRRKLIIIGAGALAGSMMGRLTMDTLALRTVGAMAGIMAG